MLLLGRPLQEILKAGSVVSNRIMIKFGRIVLQGNTHRLTESDIWYDVTLNMAVMTSFYAKYCHLVSAYPASVHVRWVEVRASETLMPVRSINLLFTLHLHYRSAKLRTLGVFCCARSNAGADLILEQWPGIFGIRTPWPRRVAMVIYCLIGSNGTSVASRRRGEVSSETILTSR